MATSTKQSTRKPATKARKAPAKPKAKPSAPRTKHSDDVVAIATAARKLACPVTEQGPVPKQVADIMATLKDPRAALKEAGLTQAQVRKLANGEGTKETRAALRPLGERVAKAGGAPQWVRGRSLAATLTAWLAQ